MQSNFFLLLQLGYFEALGGWEQINESPRRLQAVTAADIQRVANQYFDKTNRSVAIYNRTPNATPMDEALLALSPDQQRQVSGMIRQMQGYSLPQIRLFRQRMQELPANLPPDQLQDVLPMATYLLQKIDDRIAELESEEK